jgi:hypothetical protein
MWFPKQSPHKSFHSITFYFFLKWSLNNYWDIRALTVYGEKIHKWHIWILLVTNLISGLVLHSLFTQFLIEILNWMLITIRNSRYSMYFLYDAITLPRPQLAARHLYSGRYNSYYIVKNELGRTDTTATVCSPDYFSGSIKNVLNIKLIRYQFWWRFISTTAGKTTSHYKGPRIWLGHSIRKGKKTHRKSMKINSLHAWKGNIKSYKYTNISYYFVWIQHFFFLKFPFTM